MLVQYDIAGDAGLTDDEATIRVVGASTSPAGYNGCRRRASDLKAAGYIEPKIDPATGKQMERLNPQSPSEGGICVITAAGKAALARLVSTGWSL